MKKYAKRPPVEPYKTCVYVRDIISERKTGMESLASSGVGKGAKEEQGSREGIEFFQMPLHYPNYSKSDYETMPEWKLDHLLSEYGLPVVGSVEQKKKFAMGAFLWPQLSF